MAKKGNVAELDVARDCQAWWSRVEPGCRFVRTPRSGGWQHSAEFDAAGDLMVAHAPRWPWCVEVKRREAWDVGRLLGHQSTPPWRWWAGAVRDARKVQREPMLWFRQNRRPWLVMLGRELVERVLPRGAYVTWHVELLRRAGVPDDAMEVPAALMVADALLARDPRLFAGIRAARPGR